MSRDGLLLRRTKPLETALAKHLKGPSKDQTNLTEFQRFLVNFPNLGVPLWSTRGSARDNWCFGTSVCKEEITVDSVQLMLHVGHLQAREAISAKEVWVRNPRGSEMLKFL